MSPHTQIYNGRNIESNRLSQSAILGNITPGIPKTGNYKKKRKTKKKQGDKDWQVRVYSLLSALELTHGVCV